MEVPQHRAPPVSVQGQKWTKKRPPAFPLTTWLLVSEHMEMKSSTGDCQERCSEMRFQILLFCQGWSQQQAKSSAGEGGPALRNAQTLGQQDDHTKPGCPNSSVPI